MSSSLAPGWRTDVHGLPPRHPVDDVGKALQLAKQLCECVSAPAEGERAHGVRMRLVRAHALSIMDLLADIVADSSRGT